MKTHKESSYCLDTNVNGYLFTSKSNGNSIFVPAAGGSYMPNEQRYCGLTIRPVRVKK